MKTCHAALLRQTIRARLRPQIKMESQNYMLVFVEGVSFLCCALNHTLLVPSF